MVPASGDLAQPGTAPLDPKVRAQIRREDGDQAQLQWDATTNAPGMLQALLDERGADPAILIPPAKFMETANKLLIDRGGQLDPAIMTGVLRTCSRKLVQGRFGEMCLFLRHAWGGINVKGTSDELMADLVRELFPVAPSTWHAVQQPFMGSRRRLTIDDGQPTRQAPNYPRRLT